MKKAPVIILLACINLLLCSCNKFSIGNIKEEPLPSVDSFQVIEIRDDIDVILKHCTTATAAGTISLKTGENLFEGIHAVTEEHLDTEGGDTLKFTKLVITNDNAYNNFRPHSHTPQMTIYYDTLYKLIFHSNAPNVRTDTLRGYNILTHFTNDTIEWDSLAPNLAIEIEGGSGTFNVLTNCYKLITKYIHGTSTLNIKGKAMVASAYADYDCHGIINSKELFTHIYYITTYSTNIVKTQAYHLLDIKNGNIGEVHYLKYFTQKVEHFWNDTLHQPDSIIKTLVHPEVIHYDSIPNQPDAGALYLDPWTYNNSIRGLVMERE